MTNSTLPQNDPVMRGMTWLVMLAVVVALLFVFVTSVQRMLIIQQDYNDDVLRIPVQRLPDDPNNAVPTEEIVDAAAILERAEDTQNSIDLLLSFLEGASVILAVAFGAAAVYNVRRFNDLRVEIKEDQAQDLARIQAELDLRLDEALDATARMQTEIDALRQEVIETHRVRDELLELKPYLTQLEKMDTMEDRLETAHSNLAHTISNVGKLLQADQEFRLRNYRVSYRFISEVLDDEPENALALYLAGWVETQHIDEAADVGLAHLETLLRLEPGWPSAIAAYGVALRRKAMRMGDRERQYDENLMNRARGKLLDALGMDPDLVDFNQESFWGPLGGLLRDMGKIDEALEAYGRALEVTPGSSYPKGNQASLLLRKAQDDETFERQALNAFEETIELARNELANKPNDYFLLMDLSMAYTVLMRADQRYIDIAEENLHRALVMNPSRQHLGVSKRGWGNLAAYLPRRLAWQKVRDFIDRAIDRMDAAIADRK